MNKGNIKILLIGLAALLAIVVIYKILKSKADAKGKEYSAEADLNIRRAEDEYQSNRESVRKEAERENVSLLEQTTIADGITTLEDYLSSLTEDEKAEYKEIRNEYIRITGVDPGLMDIVTLRNWIGNYFEWSELNDEYLRLTGESKSILDPDFDTPQEMLAAIETAKAEIEIARKRAEVEWNECYVQFNAGTDGLKGFGGFSEVLLKEYCPTTSKLTAFHNYLNGLYLEWNTGRKSELDSFMSKKLYPAIRNDIKWSRDSGSKVDWVNAFDMEICNELIDMSEQDLLYLAELYNTDKYPAVTQNTRVNSLRKAHDSKTLYTLSSALRNRLAISGISYTPSDANSSTASFSLTHTSQNQGCERTELVTVDGKKYKINAKALRLVDAIYSIERAARYYTMTDWGYAYKKTSGLEPVVKQWAENTKDI